MIDIIEGAAILILYFVSYRFLTTLVTQNFELNELKNRVKRLEEMERKRHETS